MNLFETLGLSQPVVDAINDLGFSEPTPIQSKAIPHLLSGASDLVGLAQTGTGKTAAFGLPLVDLVDPDLNYTQGLVLAPTRELCLQITKELNAFAKYRKKLRILPVYGGADIVKQMREVRKGAQIIVATPGRLRDLMGRSVAELSRIAYLVLDEADEMLNMGFKEELDEILLQTPADKCIWLFSATMPEEVRRIAREYMTDPLELRAGDPKQAHAGIEHRYIVTRPQERPDMLKRFIDSDPDLYALVFTRTRQDAEDLVAQLSQDGYLAEALHGGLTQRQRDSVMDRFRARKLRVLIATDVAARGIDVQDISHVFHFNLPQDFDFYTHRSGRTGRAGSKGLSVVFLHPKDVRLLRDIEKKQNLRFEKAEPPSGEEVFRRHMMAQARKIRDIQVNGELESFMPELLEELEGLSREDLIKRVAALSLGDKLHKLQREHREEKPAKRDPNVQYARLFINIGSMDMDNVGAFLAFICEQGGVPGSAVGRIDLQQKHAYFDLDEKLRDKMIKAFDGLELDGRALRVNAADGPVRDKKKHQDFKKKQGKKKDKSW